MFLVVPVPAFWQCVTAPRNCHLVPISLIMHILKSHCLLVDDDVDDQELFQMALGEVGKNISLVIANNGVEALNKLNEDPMYVPEFIFLDVNMPKMNGLQCLTKLKQLPHLSDAKIIMYSTSSDPKIINESKKLGATDYEIKPPSLSALIEKLSRIFTN